MNLLLATILAQVISDFIIQTDKTVKEKQKLSKKGIIRHFAEVLIPLYILLQIQYSFLNSLLFSISISVLHIIIDIVKIIVQRKLKKKYGSRIFVLDQITHTLTVLFIIMFFKLNFVQNTLLAGLTPVFKNNLLHNPASNFTINLPQIELYSVIYIFFGLGAGIFIGDFIKQFKPDISEYSDNSTIDIINTEKIEDDRPLKAGKYIGIFERLVIITLTILNQFSAIAFIIAAKSLARHEALNKKGFAEYYLLGTLLSIFIGISGGLLLNYLLQYV